MRRAQGGRLGVMLLVLPLLPAVRAQPIWDYDYTNSIASPPFPLPHMMGGFFRPPPPPPPPPPAQQTNWPPFAAGTRFASRPPSPSTGPQHRLPSPTYRETSWRANPWVASAQLMTTTEASNRGDLDSLLARLVTRLPAIADGLSRVMGTTPASPPPAPSSPDWQPFLRRSVSSSSFGGNRDIVNGKEVDVKKEEDARSAPATVVNSMPDPSAFFSFGKLISAFTGSSLDQKPPVASTEQPKEEPFDVESVKGIPILKDEDEQSEVVEKADETLVPGFPSEATSSPFDKTDEPIIFTLPTNSVEDGGSSERTTQQPTTAAPNPAENLLGSLLNGKLETVDWMGSIFGNGRKSGEKTGESDGNALAQLFSGGFFGSAVGPSNDEKKRKFEDRNFH